MKKRCDNCGGQAEVSYRHMFASLVLCTACEELANPKEDTESQEDNKSDFSFEDLEILGNLGIEDIPLDIQKSILEQIKKNGWDPQDGKLVAIDGSKVFGDLGPDEIEQLMRKFVMLAARSIFLHATQTTLATFHAVHHAGIDREELVPIIKRFTAMQRELLADYLFYGQTDEMDLDGLAELNLDMTVNCKCNKDTKI